MIQNHLTEIFNHFDAEYPREGCGAIGVVKGKSKWFPCKNISEDDNDFIMDSSDYIRASLKSDIVAIVHSHPDTSEEPSEADVKMSNSLNLDSYIFSWPEGKMYHLKPNRKEVPLLGREYEFGVLDCWQLVIDYYETIGISLKRSIVAYEDNWWEKGLNYFDDLFHHYGFEEVTDGSIQKHDGLMFNIRSSVPNHCGVYLGNDKFLHHAENRLSCREILTSSLWGKNKYKIVRHKQCKE